MKRRESMGLGYVAAMARPLDWSRLEAALLARLADGPAGAPELQKDLEISQPSLSRLIAKVGRPIVAFGNARLRRYALRQLTPPLPLPVYEVTAYGEIREAFGLEAVAPTGLVVTGARRIHAGIYDELPWFLDVVRPTGFLARFAGVPQWTDDAVLEEAIGHPDLPGSWLFGRYAAENRAAYFDDPPHRVTAEAALTYAHWADHPPVTVGWVAGEQPQFLAIRDDVPVIVKFSPPRGDPASDGIADRLVAEHLALTTLAEAGHPAPPTRLLQANGRVFLEVERFDRTRHGGRRGFVTLRALHLEHVEEEPTRPSATSERLLDRRLIDETIPIAEVAMQLGFTEATNFTKWFRRAAHTTPKAFRQL
ncbi:MAG: HipA domain-containing protein, partial [Myxococcota bacterium]